MPPGRSRTTCSLWPVLSSGLAKGSSGSTWAAGEVRLPTTPALTSSSRRRSGSPLRTRSTKLARRSRNTPRSWPNNRAKPLAPKRPWTRRPKRPRRRPSATTRRPRPQRTVRGRIQGRGRIRRRKRGSRRKLTSRQLSAQSRRLMRAARAVTEAAQQAPAEPGRLEKLKREAGDLLQRMGRAIGGVAGGAGSAVVDVYKTARAVTPLDPYNRTRPAARCETATALAAGPIGVAQSGSPRAHAPPGSAGRRETAATWLGSVSPRAVAAPAGGAGVAGEAGRGGGRGAGEVEELAG